MMIIKLYGEEDIINKLSEVNFKSDYSMGIKETCVVSAFVFL